MRSYLKCHRSLWWCRKVWNGAKDKPFSRRLCSHHSGAGEHELFRGKMLCQYNCQSCAVVGKVEVHHGYSREGSTVCKMSTVNAKKRGCSARKKLTVCAARNKHRLKEKETWKVWDTVAHMPSPAIRSGCLLGTLLPVPPMFCLQTKRTHAECCFLITHFSPFLC